MWNLYIRNDKRTSFFQQGIQSALSPFKICIHSTLGDGTTTLFLYDNWILGQGLRFLWPIEYAQSYHTLGTVNALLDPLKILLPQLAQIITDLSTVSL